MSQLQAGPRVQYLHGSPKSDSLPTFLPYLEKVPIETWGECWRHCESRELRKVSLSCRLFSQICRPILFRELNYRAPHPDAIKRRNWKAWVRQLYLSFQRLSGLSTSPHALLVREWNFHGAEESLDMTHLNIEGIDAIHKIYDNIPRAFLVNIYRSENLQTLNVSDLEIDGLFLGVLLFLPRLESMTLESCTFTCRTLAPMLELRTFNLITLGHNPPPTQDPEPIEIFSPRKLERLSLCLLKEVAFYMTFFSSFGILEHLTHLTLRLPDCKTHVLLPFLENCPFLKSLDITMESPDGVQKLPSIVLPTVIPLLGRFRGSPALAEIFIPGRPVESVELISHFLSLKYSNEPPYDYARISNILHGLMRSSVQLRSLTLFQYMLPNLDVFVLIQSLFPQLRKLIMRVHDTRPRAPWRPLVQHHDYAIDSDSDDYSEVDDVNYISDDDDDLDHIATAEDFQPILGDERPVAPNGGNTGHALPPVPEPLRDEISAPVELESNEVVEPTVADIELDESGLPARDPNTFGGMMFWLVSKHIQLPVNLEVLEIQLSCGRDEHDLTLADQRRVVTELSPSLPHLRKIVLEWGGWLKECNVVWKHSSWHRGSVVHSRLYGSNHE